MTFFKNLDIENIEDEYWKHIYHFQGYLLTVNNSFEDFNQKVFNEYLDIHKVEDRIKSGLPDSLELDRRFNGVYEDLNNYYRSLAGLPPDPNTVFNVRRERSNEKYEIFV